MENEEENNGLRSIERSKLRGAGTTKKARSAAKSRSTRRRSDELLDDDDSRPPRPSGRKRRDSMKLFFILGALIVAAIVFLSATAVLETETAIIAGIIALMVAFIFSMTAVFATKRMIVLAILMLGGAFFLLTTTFATASLDLTLASARVSIDGVFSAVREPAQSAGISYSKRGPYTEIREAAITTITKERRNTRAEGEVMVYNTNASGSSLELVNRTRFKAEDGRIYRLIGKQVIPGGKTVGDNFVPGSKIVKVGADKVGDEFNVSEKGVRFTIPGLATNREFGDSYALSKTQIVGGFSGERFIPDTKEEEKVREQLRREIEKALRDSLAQALDTNSLSERVVFEDGIFITYESLEHEQTDESVVVKEKGVLYAISFREAELAGLLAKYTSMPALSSVRPTNVDADNLTMEMQKDEDFDIVSSTKFSFRLTGDAKLFWNVDEHLFLSDLVDKSRSEVEDTIMNQYPQVTQVNAFSIFPIWRTTMPGNKDKITVEVDYEAVAQEAGFAQISEEAVSDDASGDGETSEAEEGSSS